MRNRVLKSSRSVLIAASASACGPWFFAVTALVVSAQDAPPAGREKPADAANPAVAHLANGPPFDLITVKGQREALKVRSTLARPVRPSMFRTGEIIQFKQYRPDRAEGGASVGIKAENIAKVELFEEILAREGDRALERRDFLTAFDLFARLVKMDPNWPKAKEKLYAVFYQQAEQALAAAPPDFDAAIALCVQLRAEDRKATGVQALLRRACLGRAEEALKTNDFATARDQVELFFQNFPSDPEVTRFQQDRIVKRARALVEEAEKAMEGELDDQRRAVGLLLTARHIWPDVPQIDRLILRAKRNYPVLNVAIFEEPGTFEPLGAESLSEWQACQLLFDWLFEPDESGGQFYRGPFVPQGGYSQSGLGLKQSVTIDRGHRWNDGKPITAYDVENSLRLQNDPRSANFDPERARFMRDVVVKDPYSLLIELARPHPRPLSLLNIPLLPKHEVAEPPKRGTPFTRAPVGSGPFVVGKPDAPQQTKFVANPVFRGATQGQPYIKEINFHHYVKSSAAVRDLDDGKAHLMTRLEPLEVPRFSKLTGQFEVRSYLSNSVYWLAINHRRKPLDDQRVRRAMLLAMDRQAILTQYFLAGPGELAHRVISGPFPTHSPAHDPMVTADDKDDTLARQLVEEVKKAGKLDARTFTLKYPLGDSAVEKAASQIKKDLQKVGLDVKTEAKIENDLRQEVIVQQDFDLVYWRHDHRNVLYNIASLFDPEQMQAGGTNFMGYQHPELAKLFSHLRQEQRPLEIWQHQREIHRFIHREVVFVPLWQLDNYIAHTSRLTYRAPVGESALNQGALQLPIHPLYLFRKTEGWYLEP
jgi:ABC-type transport system substrate-binding protein